jgi:hypothetical protein
MKPSKRREGRQNKADKRNETHSEFTEERYAGVTQQTKRRWQKTINMYERPAERKNDGWQ